MKQKPLLFPALFILPIFVSAQDDLGTGKKPIVVSELFVSYTLHAQSGNGYLRKIPVRSQESLDTSYFVAAPAAWETSFFANPNDEGGGEIIYIKDPNRSDEQIYEFEMVGKIEDYCICDDAFVARGTINPMSPPPAGIRMVTNVPGALATFHSDKKDRLIIQFPRM